MSISLNHAQGLDKNTFDENLDKEGGYADVWTDKIEDMEGTDNTISSALSAFLDSDHASHEKVMYVLELLNIDDDGDIDETDIGSLSYGEKMKLISTLTHLAGGGDIPEDDLSEDDRPTIKESGEFFKSQADNTYKHTLMT